MCDFFVKKDPSKSLAEQDKIKEGLLLYPRKAYKSTLSIVDCVQWIICFPNIRILVLTGLDSLATAFVDELNEYFCIQDEEKPSLFQALFPEFCIRPKNRYVGEFHCPARTKYSKDPTVAASSIESNNSGWAVDLLKCDDVVTDENAENALRIAKVTKKYHMARKLVMSYGYRETIGTRYELEDLYGQMLQTYGIQELYGDIRKPEEFKYLSLPAWWKKGSLTYETPDLNELPNEDEVEILFPENLSYRFLCREWKNDKHTFASQQLNDPIGASDVIFRREEMVAATLPYQQLPSDGRTYIAWDLAYSAKKGRDWCVGAVGRYDSAGRLWILECIRGRYKPHELPFVIVKAIKDWSPEQTGIEHTVGVQWLMPEMDRYARQMGVELKVNYFELETKTGATEERVKNLETLLNDKRLIFSANISCLDRLYFEFERWTPKIVTGGTAFTGHDDIIKAISWLQKFRPQSGMPQDQEGVNTAMRRQIERDLSDRVYGMGIFAPAVPAYQEPVDPYTGLPC